MNLLCRIRRAALVVALVLAPAAAWAQGTPVFQSGTMVKARNLAMITRNGQIQDAGGLLGDALTGRGTNPFSVTDDNGLGLCFNNHATSSSYSSFCFGHNASGTAIVTINGTEFDFPGPGNGDVLAPLSAPAAGQAAVWNGAKTLRDGGPYVGNVADTATLAATATSVFAAGVNRLSPPGLFTPASGTCAAASRVNDVGSCVDATGGNSWVAVVPALGLPATQFGADPTFAADSTAALQAWGTWAAAAEGRCGWLPAGRYKTTGALTWTGGKNWCLRGAGQGASRIIYAGASTTADIVTISHAIQIRLEGWGVDSTTSMSAGRAIHFEDVNYSHFSEITTGQGGKLNNGDPHPTPMLYNGMHFENTAWNVLDGSSPYVKHDAVMINQGVELKIENFISINQGAACIHLAGGFGGLYLGYVSCIGIQVGTHGFLVDNSLTAGTNLQIFVSPHAVFDSHTVANALINDNVATGNGLKALTWNGWAGGAAAGQPGLYVQQWNNGTVKVTGSTNLVNNGGPGLKLADALALVSIDAAATINGNGGYGVECTTAMTNIVSDDQSQIGTWGNISGAYSANCGGQLTRVAWPTFTPTVACAGTGTPPTLTTANGSYLRYGRKVHTHYSITLSSTSTCSAGLLFSWPPAVTFLNGCTFHGKNIVDSTMVGGISTVSPDAVLVLKYDGTVAQTSGFQFILDGECEAL